MFILETLRELSRTIKNNMKSWLKKKFRQYIYPVFSPATGLLFFTIVLFDYHYYGNDHEIYGMMRKDHKLLYLFYAYFPVLLAVNFFTVAPWLAGFAAFVTFVVTLLGMVTLENALMEGIRRQNVFDVIVMIVVVTQVVILTFRLLKYIRSISGIFNAPKEMNLVPSPLLAVSILVIVPLITYSGDKLNSDPHQLTDIVVFAGTMMIYFWKVNSKEAKAVGMAL
jgi:uncharacterized membrane protein